MSNNLTKKPINISPQNIYGKCDLKCVYNFKYDESALSVKNNGINISLTYDDSNTPPVSYNEVKYNVSQIMLFSPSLHLFNNSKVEAEIIVEHVPQSGGSNLFVCVPIIKSSDSTSSSVLLSQIVAGVAANAPAANETTNLNLSGFTLNKIIPKSPFFSYSGTYSSSTADFIVFGKNNAIPLSEKVLTALSSIIKPFPLPMIGDNLFFNDKGPNIGGNNGDGIYISCQPTGSSEEETDITNTKSSSDSDVSVSIGNLFNSSAFKIFIKIVILIIVFIAIFAMIAFCYSKITNTQLKMPEFKELVPKKTT
jgi:carbonic anhydrase